MLIAWFANLTKANVQGRGNWFKFRLFAPRNDHMYCVRIFKPDFHRTHPLKILYTILGFNKIIYDYDNGVGLADDIRVIYGKLF